MGYDTGVGGRGGWVDGVAIGERVAGFGGKELDEETRERKGERKIDG